MRRAEIAPRTSYLFVVHAAHVMLVDRRSVLILATGHFAVLAFFAATAFFLGCWCRFGGEGGGGHCERKRAEQIFGFHDKTPLDD